MSELLETISEPESLALVITRELDAPRELVFKAWTEPERLAQWWGPAGFTMVSLTVDLRPGGRFHYLMRSPAGEEMWGRFVYHEIVEPERIVYTNSFSDAEGNAVRAPFSSDWPLEVLNILTFTERDGKTILTLHGAPVDATEEERTLFREMHGSMQKGFGGTFRQLEEYLRNEHEGVAERP